MEYVEPQWNKGCGGSLLAKLAEDFPGFMEGEFENWDENYPDGI